MERNKTELDGRGGADDEAPQGLQDTLSLHSSSSDGIALRSRTSVRQHLQHFIRSTQCQVLLMTESSKLGKRSILVSTI